MCRQTIHENYSTYKLYVQAQNTLQNKGLQVLVLVVQMRLLSRLRDNSWEANPLLLSTGGYKPILSSAVIISCKNWPAHRKRRNVNKNRELNRSQSPATTPKFWTKGNWAQQYCILKSVKVLVALWLPRYYRDNMVVMQVEST